MEIQKKEENRGRGMKFSVQENGQEIGRAFLYVLYNDLHKEPFGLLEDVFVRETHRGKGIGTALIQAVIAEAKARGCYKLIAQSRYGRESAHMMYEKMGMTNHGYNFRMDLSGA